MKAWRQGRKRWGKYVGPWVGPLMLGCLVLTRGLPAQEPGSAAGTPAGETSAATPGQDPYAQHCAACHGTDGGGKGKAAVFLFPKPRNFRAGKYRLVSTINNAPTRDDLDAVLTRGMPGSSMPSWAHLAPEQRSLLIDEVVRLWKEGSRERYIANLQQAEQLSEEELADAQVQEEIAAAVEQETTPGELSAVPELPPSDAAAVARGQKIFIAQSCHSCHGTEGKGDGVQKMIEDDGTPTRPRDLTRGIFKGGHDVASLYRRTYYGMPGTPMPASRNLTPQQIADMVHFMRSLSTEEQRQSVILKRGRLTAQRVAQVPEEVQDAQWDTYPAVAVPTFPLWWRDESDPHLQVQAVHDGQTLAVRLSWRDETQDGRAVRTDEFEDMAAVQFFRGSAEPFLGMGAAGAPVDLWHWRAGRSQEVVTDSQLDDYPFDTPVYREHVKGDLPDFITGRAAGNPLAVRDHSADNLAAGGHGSTTFRPRPSQLVVAQQRWQEGRWVVVLRRPLAAGDDGGLTLAAGDHCAVAFAVWDGAHHDRNGQKVISIWHDFELE